MSAFSVLGKTLRKFANNKRLIFRRLVIYFLILLMAFPIVFLNRHQIYSTLIVRHDDWYERNGVAGIPVAEYGVQNNVYVGPQVTPRIVANAGFAYHEQMKEGNTTAALYFNNTVDWMVENVKYSYVPSLNGTMKIAHWPFDFAIWNLARGWHQSMTDAKGIRLLALAYQEYGNESYLDIIDSVTNSFLVPMSLGGNVYTLEDGLVWYPEYVVSPHLDLDYEPSLILNGFLIGLHNLKEGSKILNDSKIEHVFNVGVITAAAWLPKYDSPYNWTLYHLDFPMKLASRLYHRIHINEAEYLFENTNITVFNFYAERWKSYDSPPLFTIEEFLAPDFLYFGGVMALMILIPTIFLDILQHKIRHRSKIEQEISSEVESDSET